MGLWRVQYTAMHKYADGKQSPSEMKDLVIAEVKRAARLIDTGLWSFSLAVQGHNGRESMRVAALSANEARKQVMAAMKQAKAAWKQMVTEVHEAEHGPGRVHGRPGPMPPNRGRRPRPGDPGREFGRRR